MSGEGLIEPPPQTPPLLFLGLLPRFGLHRIWTHNFRSVVVLHWHPVGYFIEVVLDIICLKKLILYSICLPESFKQRRNHGGLEGLKSPWQKMKVLQFFQIQRVFLGVGG